MLRPLDLLGALSDLLRAFAPSRERPIDRLWRHTQRAYARELRRRLDPPT